jgi:plasmid stabilization system protein ParE
VAAINWTSEAQHWLREIHRYIAQDNVVAAAEVVARIHAKAQLLREFPLIGYRYDTHADRHIRILLYGHYRIAYLLREDGDIDILGVFHGAMELKRYLTDESR